MSYDSNIINASHATAYVVAIQADEMMSMFQVQQNIVILMSREPELLPVVPVLPEWQTVAQFGWKFCSPSCWEGQQWHWRKHRETDGSQSILRKHVNKLEPRFFKRLNACFGFQPRGGEEVPDILRRGDVTFSPTRMFYRTVFQRRRPRPPRGHGKF